MTTSNAVPLSEASEIYIWFADPKPVYGGDGERFIRAWTANVEQVASLRDAIGKEPTVYSRAHTPSAQEEAVRVAALRDCIAICDDVIGKAVRAGLTQRADCASSIAVAIRVRLAAASAGDQEVGS